MPVTCLSRCAWVVVSLAVVATLAGADVGAGPDGRPLVPAVRVSAPPEIDGVLDDPVWRTAPRLDDFYNFQLDTDPVDPTWIWVLYDSAHIYFAARCFDREPHLISAEETKRGGTTGNDDHLSLNLDLTDQACVASGWYFKVTARGTQSELVPGGSASKTEWRGDWLARARIDSLGWTVEAAIPLTLLQASDDVDTVAIYVDRWVPRRQEWSAWPNMGVNYDLGRTGRLAGLRLPVVRQRPVIMPYVVGEYDAGRRDGYVGVDMKHTTGAGTRIVGTINPDYRNVETEVLSLGFSYTERFRADNRPFFVEGADYLPGTRLFYSQRVGEVYGGGKIAGSRGAHSYGVLGTYDRDDVLHVAGRWFAQPNPRLEIDHALVWRHSADPTTPRADLAPTRDNVAVESRIAGTRLSGPATTTYEVRGAATHSVDTVGTGYDVRASVSRAGGNGRLSPSVSWEWMSAKWQPLDGYFDPDYTDLHQFSGGLSYSLRRGESSIRTWSASMSAGRSIRPNGDVFTQSVSASTNVETRGDRRYSVSASFSERESFADRSYSTSAEWNVHRLYTSGSISLGIGRSRGEDYRTASLTQGLRPLGNLSAALAGQLYNRAGVNQRQVRATLQYDISPERAVTGRVVRTDDDVNAYGTYRQVVRSGVDLFLIVGDPSAPTWRRRVAVKAVMVL